MYAIREAHIDTETGERTEIEQFVAWFFGFNSEELYSSYEAAKERVETFLVPHAEELSRGYDLDYYAGTVVTNDSTGRPMKWCVKRTKYFHTEYRIEERP